MPYLEHLAERKFAQAKREKLPARQFIFPKDKTWPIHDVKHSKIALIWSTWPQHKSVAKKVRDAVFKKFKALKKWFKGGKYTKEAAEVLGVSMSEAREMRRQSTLSESGSLGTIGDQFKDRLEAVRGLIEGDDESNYMEGQTSKSFGDTQGIVEDAETAVLVTFGRHGHSLSGPQKTALRGLLGRLAEEIVG